MTEETKININAENLKRLKELSEVFNLNLELFINKLLEKDLEYIDLNFMDTIDFLKSMR